MNWIVSVVATFTVSRMPQKPLPESEKKVTIGVRVSPAVEARLKQLADADERTVSFIAAKMIEAGIAAMDRKAKR